MPQIILPILNQCLFRLIQKVKRATFLMNNNEMSESVNVLSEPLLFSYVLKRPLSSSPQFLLGFMGSLSLLCLIIAIAWAYMGATWVLVFAVVDVLALTAAVIWCFRHSMDKERIVLSKNTLSIEREVAGRSESWIMQRFYVRLSSIEVSLGPFKSPRLKVSAQDQSVVLGGFCHSSAIKQLEKQLKLALRD
jgi:uncharacterized membrane protein